MTDKEIFQLTKRLAFTSIIIGSYIIIKKYYDKLVINKSIDIIIKYDVKETDYKKY